MVGCCHGIADIAGSSGVDIVAGAAKDAVTKAADATAEVEAAPAVPVEAEAIKVTTAPAEAEAVEVAAAAPTEVAAAAPTIVAAAAPTTRARTLTVQYKGECVAPLSGASGSGGVGVGGSAGTVVMCYAANFVIVSPRRAHREEVEIVRHGADSTIELVRGGEALLISPERMPFVLSLSASTR